MAERKIEAEVDHKDRQKEKEELEELKARILAEGHQDPNAEFERVSLYHSRLNGSSCLQENDTRKIP